MNKDICETCGLPNRICCCKEMKGKDTNWSLKRKGRDQQLYEKFEKIHNDGAEDFGFGWLGINQELVDLVSNEFPEINTSLILNKTLLSRLAYWAAEKAKEKNTPPRIEIVETD